jgi:transglutaminase-like putative cysteine protease
MSDQIAWTLGSVGGPVATGESLDQSEVEWSSIRRSRYLMRQWARYEYDGPIRGLRQRLIVRPPRRHGDQRRLGHGLEVVGAACPRIVEARDAFGNDVIEVEIDAVEREVTFASWSLVERTIGRRRYPPLDPRDVERLLTPGRLTRPTAALRLLARELGASGLTGDALARRACAAVFDRMTYEHDVTDVRTTASEALKLGRGVCQDYAHIMLAICRLLGLPARYVSGQLLGRGGSHAWTEVLVDRGGRLRVLPLDPTHEREAGLTYVTVAVGRDYADVAPFSGTYRSPYAGMLTTGKHVSVLEAA